MNTVGKIRSYCLIFLFREYTDRSISRIQLPKGSASLYPMVINQTFRSFIKIYTWTQGPLLKLSGCYKTYVEDLAQRLHSQF